MNEASSPETPPSASQVTPPSDNSENQTSASLIAVGVSAELTSEVSCDISLQSPELNIPTSSASALGMKAIETIPLDCLRLNYTLARQKRHEKLAVTTSTKDIRGYAEEIMGLGYEKAVKSYQE